MEFLANNPSLLIFLYCLCAPGGLAPAALIYYIARNYDISNPLSPRHSGQDDTYDGI